MCGKDIIKMQKKVEVKKMRAYVLLIPQAHDPMEKKGQLLHLHALHTMLPEKVRAVHAKCLCWKDKTAEAEAQTLLSQIPCLFPNMFNANLCVCSTSSEIFPEFPRNGEMSFTGMLKRSRLSPPLSPHQLCPRYGNCTCCCLPTVLGQVPLRLHSRNI